MTPRVLPIALLAACAHATAVGPAAPADTTVDPALTAKVDAIAGEVMKTGHIAAISVAVSRGDRIVVARAYGDADRTAHTAATPDTVFHIGSITKQFTAAAIMQLVEQHRIGLDDPISKYLADFPLQGKTVTVRQLLTHTSGIYDYTDKDFFEHAAATDLSVAQLIARFAGKPFEFEPGTQWAYSNSNYVLLGAIIEQVTKQRYADYLAAQVYPKAGLIATTYCAAPPHEARGYTLEDGKLVDAKPISMTTPYAAGALCSTATDLVRWSRALHAGKVVSAASYTAMTTPVRLADGTTRPYGFGLTVSELEGHDRIAHNGGINGFVSTASLFPKDDVAVAILVSTESSAADKLDDRVSRAALDLAPPLNKDLPLLANEQARYVGSYSFPEVKLTITISIQDGKLVTQAEGQPAVAMTSQGHDVFHLLEHDEIVLTFHVAGDHADTLTVEQGGLKLVGKREP